MRVIIVLASALVAVSAFSLPESQVQKEWVAFKAKYNKKYKDAAEETKRRGVFGENLNLIERHNLRFKEGLYTFKVGINKNTDLLLQEIYSKVAGVRLGSAAVPRAAAAGQHVADLKVAATALPTTVDWKAKGYVTAVGDQGQCGSCWAFAANGALEGQLFKKTGKLVPLSVQNLVDCSNGKFTNWGCDGGDMDSAFTYIKANKGIDTEASYPYLGKNGTKCNYNPKNSGGTLTGFVDVKATERDLQDAVAKVGPVAVAIDASSWGFIHYASGVYYECGCSPTQLDHAVLVVGYGTAGKDDYWLAKNSFGKDWGEDGYVRMARNKNNHCGIASQASYPTV